ncbi:MAG: Rdx family protein [Pseudomonadales bacterium]|nr:Rdx family protein [Pseudomonadales bacterium]
MTAELEAHFTDIEVELIADGKGIFDVIVGGVLIYSKYETGRFPEAGEVSKLIK